MLSSFGVGSVKDCLRVLGNYRESMKFYHAGEYPQLGLWPLSVVLMGNVCF